MKNFSINYSKGCIEALGTDEHNFIWGFAPLFALRMRNDAGELFKYEAQDAKEVRELADSFEYIFDCGISVEVCVTCNSNNGFTTWGINVKNNTNMAVECVDYPNIPFARLKKNSGDGAILFPYNEGVLIDDALMREGTGFDRRDAQYPSEGLFTLFPNMICSQFMAYMAKGCGVYIGAHDKSRGLKGFDYNPTKDGVVLSVRTYTGCDFGNNYTMDYPLVTKVFTGGWEDGAEIYRNWFYDNLPPNLTKAEYNKNLPDWYKEHPLIVAYPVRGKHDMDKMEPNSLFPYVNALPLIDEISAKTDSKVMALLMHWEGTAPWAPPYVWPPYGGSEALFEFRDKLHEKGHLLGVYCSGFGWTYESNLIDYNRREEWHSGSVESAMCAGPDGKVAISRICTGQRSGYDLCPASDKAKEILMEAYAPLFEAGIDYAQILDQNHGGGQYLCYSRDHGHPPMPGSWMTENMQKLLSDWNKAAPGMLFGCESAAAEPFLGNLLFSDNRYELNYHLGTPVPLYAYIYHEYLHNFMGNQVCCPLDVFSDTLRYRLAYSFVAGDCLTLVVNPEGELLPHWGSRDGVNPDKEKTLKFIKNLLKLYKTKAKPYLLYGKMEKSLPVICSNACYSSCFGEDISLPSVYSAAWSYQGKNVQILVNPTDTVQNITVGDKTFTVDALDALLLNI